MKDDYNLNGNKLIKGLKERGLSARDIDIVVLSNLHFDHSGGCTKLDRTGTAIPMFPNAVYMMQRSSWEAAQDPNERYMDSFYEEDYEPLAERDMVKFLDDGDEIIPGVTVKLAPGPSRGQSGRIHRVRQRADSVRGRPDTHALPPSASPHTRDRGIPQRHAGAEARTAGDRHGGRMADSLRTRQRLQLGLRARARRSVATGSSRNLVLFQNREHEIAPPEYHTAGLFIYRVSSDYRGRVARSESPALP